MNKNRKLSVVIPFYNEEASLTILYKKIIKNIKKLISLKFFSDFEILYIDDGSNDTSLEQIEKIIEKNNNVKLISLRKNFGKTKALAVGFEHANGDIIITMDADLQDDPDEFINLIQKIDEGYDLVSGWKNNRIDPLEKKIPSKFFNFITSKLSGIDIHDFNCGFKAYRKDVIKNIQMYSELHRYIPVLAARNGFKITEIKVKHHKREYGLSKFGVERYLRGLFDAFTSLFLLKFYNSPMYFFGKIGMFFFIAGFIINLYLTLLWFNDEKIGNRPLLILGVLFIIVGIQSIFFGLLANIIIDKQKNDNNIAIKNIIDKNYRDLKIGK